MIRYYKSYNSATSCSIIYQKLIALNTSQFCNLIGDQACVFMNSNFKILFNQTTQDNFGNWVLNGEAQNIGANPLNNVMVVWHLYDALGNIVGVTQGFPIPSNLGIGQTTIFNLQDKANRFDRST